MPKLTRYEAILLLLFVLTLPFSNPWVRGDGVGYYAFARSMLIEHRLDFTYDWQKANASFRMYRVDAAGNVLPDQYTSTGHIGNHYAIGPAILWSPFLIAAHAGVLAYDRLGGHVAADGYSRPYLIAMALGTAFYGFMALWISFVLARQYVAERWAFLATVGIWFASSLPVYMYFNPSWSHAQSAFVVALFLWYWMRTRNARTVAQWAILGALGGLMMDVYYVTAVMLLLPLLESLAGYRASLKTGSQRGGGDAISEEPGFYADARSGVFAHAHREEDSVWRLLPHGLYGTVVLEVARVFQSLVFIGARAFQLDADLVPGGRGIIYSAQIRSHTGAVLLIVFAAYVYAIGCYQDWHGISSYGNRFFVGLTPVFVLGLAALFDWLAREWHGRRAAILSLWRGGGAGRLEPGTDLPMGHASDSGSRADFLAECRL